MVNPPDAFVMADARLPDGAPAGPGFFVDDTGADWNGPEASFSFTAVASYGAIEPVAYYAGGLLVRASDDGTFTNPTAATWNDVAAMTFTDTRAVMHGVRAGWGSGVPTGVGLGDGDNLTITLEGEIYLSSGAWTFYAAVDDHLFMDIAQPVSTIYTRVISASVGAEESAVFNATSDGWYPVRIAMSEIGGGASLSLQYSGPGVPTRADITRHRLRFRADAIAGMTLSAFDDSRMLGDRALTIDATSPANVDWLDGNPLDLALTGSDTFATRWAGQLRIDEPGDYTFRYITDDGQRLWVDGVRVLDDWDDTSHDNSATPISLEPGWHDLTIDHTESTGAARAVLTMASNGGAAEPLQPSNLRPVVNRRERYDTGVDRTDRSIPDNGTTTASIAIDAPAGAKVRGLEVSYSFTHTYHGDLELRLRAPDGSVTVLRDSVGGNANGAVTERLHVTALDDASAAGTWQLEARDTTSLDTGTLSDFQLTVHHRAGEDSVPRTASYISNVKDLGPAMTGYEMLSWGERLAPGASVSLRVRSGGSPSEVTGAPWSTPLVDANGSEVPEIPRRYFQYRIDFESDGDGAPAVDWVRLDYDEGTE